MNWRLPAMILGSAACLASLIIPPGIIRNAPLLLNVQLSSLNALLGWAYVLAATLLPVICIVSLWRGWFAWTRGPREEALARLLLWPALAVLASASLYVLGRLVQA